MQIKRQPNLKVDGGGGCFAHEFQYSLFSNARLCNLNVCLFPDLIQSVNLAVGGSCDCRRLFRQEPRVRGEDTLSRRAVRNLHGMKARRLLLPLCRIESFGREGIWKLARG